jgi:hypothetical protein
MTVRFKLSMTVRLENIVDDGPLEALSMTVHMAFVDDRTLPRKTGSAYLCQPKCVDDSPIQVDDDSPVGEHFR